MSPIHSHYLYEARSTPMTESHRTQYSPETPWLCWDAWAKAQTYESQNPPWFKQFTSLWTDPEYTSVWEPHDDTGFALIHRLLNHFAVQGSLAGVVWGDPALLQRQLRLTTPPDLSWLLDAGWIVYISDEEKARREAERHASSKTKSKGSAKKRSRKETPKPTREKKPVSREEAAAAILVEQPDISRRAMAKQLGCSVATVSRLLTWQKRMSRHDEGGETQEPPSQYQESRCTTQERVEESRDTASTQRRPFH